LTEIGLLGHGLITDTSTPVLSERCARAWLLGDLNTVGCHGDNATVLKFNLIVRSRRIYGVTKV